MNLDKIISHLEYFGLDKTDAEIYTGLLRLGPTSVGIVATKLEIDRGKAYRSLAKLKNFGVVTTTFSNPTICTAVEPKNGLSVIIEKKENEIIAMKNFSKKIECIINTCKRKNEPTQSSYLSIIQGRTNIFSRIGRMVTKAKKMVFIVTTIEDLAMMYHTSIPEKIEHVKNNIDVRIITSINNDKDYNLIKRLNASEIRVCNLPSKSRIVVEKNNELIMSGGITETMNLKEENDSVLCTNSEEMVSNMFSFCSLFWKKSRSLELEIPRKNQGKRIKK